VVDIKAEDKKVKVRKELRSCDRLSVGEEIAVLEWEWDYNRRQTVDVDREAIL
jgi:hypothetical protein